MKRIILLVLFIFLFVMASSQYVPNPEQIPLQNITTNQVHNGWAVVGNSCAGCASYWYQVLETPTTYLAEDGNYYHYFYLKFYSNSNYTNGYAAATYLSLISVYADGNLVITIPYVLAPRGSPVWGGWVRTTKSNTVILFVPATVAVQ